MKISGDLQIDSLIAVRIFVDLEQSMTPVMGQMVYMGPGGRRMGNFAFTSPSQRTMKHFEAFRKSLEQDAIEAITYEMVPEGTPVTAPGVEEDNALFTEDGQGKPDNEWAGDDGDHMTFNS